MKPNDIRIKETLNSNLPQAPNDPWFRNKVMNRLPEKQQRPKFSWVERLCYITGVLILLTTWVATLVHSCRYGMSSTSLILAAALPSVALICLGVLFAPVIRRSIDL